MAKPKTQNNQDRLSQLPDSVLLHIFSFLTTYDVVHRLGPVSKHLASFRTSLPSFVFRQSDTPYNKLSSLSFISNFFILRSQNIDRFCIDAPIKVFDRRLDCWIQASLNRNLKRLELLFNKQHNSIPRFTKLYCLPKSLFRDEIHLTVLNLRRVRIKDYGCEFKWRMLKSLSIALTKLDDAMFEKILMSCRMLECLELVHCTGIKQLVIISTTLKQLKLANCTYGLIDIGDILRVSAPSLEIVDISGYICYKEYSIKNFPSLVWANLDFGRFCKDSMEKKFRDDAAYKGFSSDEWWSEGLGRYKEMDNVVNDELGYNQQTTMAREFIGSVQHVTKLYLGNWSIKVLSMQTLPCLFSRCKHVTLAMNFKQCELPRVASVLEKCPKLESLTIDMSKTWSIGCNGITLDHSGKKFWESSNPSYGHLDCLLGLKTVKVIGVAPNRGGVLVTEFLKFIMEHARLLERLTIRIDSKIKDKLKQDKETIFKLSVFHMLLSFPRSSPVAVIEVTSNDSAKSCISKKKSKSS